MNGSTMRQFVKCGYSLCTKHLYIQSSTSRILYNCTLDKSYGTSKSLQTHPHPHYSIVLGPLHAKQWTHNNGYNNLVTVNHRYYFTTLPHRGQTVLKPKSPELNDNKRRLSKDKEKISATNKIESKTTKNDAEETAAEKAAAKQPELADVQEIEEKLSLTAKFKKMYKDYWYVLLPVHIFTSTFWFAGFYYMSTSGVDIPTLLESMHVSDGVISKLRDSSLGHAAIAYLCYKIATPLRYTVTLGGTTLSIKYLSQLGYIRPVPTKAQLKQMYDDQKAKLKLKKF